MDNNVLKENRFAVLAPSVMIVMFGYTILAGILNSRGRTIFSYCMMLTIITNLQQVLIRKEELKLFTRFLNLFVAPFVLYWIYTLGIKLIDLF